MRHKSTAPTPCSIPQCTRPAIARGVCITHYWQRRDRGETGFRRLPTLADSHFWDLVHKSEDCWEWLGTLYPGGYGRFNKKYSHRVAWELSYGPIPDNLGILHHCDNPRCVRPDHLFLGTQADNNRDRRKKGRGGIRPNKTPDEIREQIRAMYSTGGITMREVGRIFFLNPTTICKIIHERDNQQLIPPD